jgi:hypothetical protein
LWEVKRSQVFVIFVMLTCKPKLLNQRRIELASMRLNVQKTMVCCVPPDSRAKKVEPSPVDAKISG